MRTEMNHRNPKLHRVALRTLNPEPQTPKPASKHKPKIRNVGVRYRSLMVPEGDLDADTVEVPAAGLLKFRLGAYWITEEIAASSQHCGMACFKSRSEEGCCILGSTFTCKGPSSLNRGCPVLRLLCKSLVHCVTQPYCLPNLSKSCLKLIQQAP